MAVTWPQQHVLEVAVTRRSSVRLLSWLLLACSLQSWSGVHGQLSSDPDAYLSMQTCLNHSMQTVNNFTCNHGSLVNKLGQPVTTQNIIQLLTACHVIGPLPDANVAPALNVQLPFYASNLKGWLQPITDVYSQLAGVNTTLDMPDLRSYMTVTGASWDGKGAEQRGLYRTDMAVLLRCTVPAAIITQKVHVRTSMANNVQQALYDSIGNASQAEGTHDLWLATASAAGTGVADNAFLALDSLVQQDASLQLSTILPVLTSAATTLGNQMLSLPLSAIAPYLFYRRDVFQAHGWQPPNTWRGLLSLVQHINGTQGMWGFGASWSCGQLGGYLFRSIFASHTQIDGIEDGWLIDPNTMQPLLDSPALTETLQVLQQLARLSAPDLSSQSTQACALQSQAFVQGKALMTIATPELFKYMAHSSRASVVGSLQGNLGITPLPGVRQVLDRDSNLLQDCSWGTCPYAQRRSENGSSLLVNYSPAFGASVWYINQEVPFDTQQQAYKLASYLVRPDTMDKMTYDPNVEAYGARNKHFRPPTWAVAGFNLSDAKQFCLAQEWTLQHPNLHLQIRTPGAEQFIQLQESLAAKAISSTVPFSDHDFTALRNSSQAQAVQILSDAFGGDLTKAAQQYRDSIQYASALGKGDGSSNSSQDSASKKSTLVIALSVILPVLLAAIIVFAVSRSLNQAASGNTNHPGPGPQTTILITDIENSTTLWENIRADVLDASLKLHNRCIRRAAMKCQGYESAWEGDSFILAFPTPSSAVQCAMQVQQDLLHLDWPPALLSSIYACPIWLQPLKPNMFLQDDDGGWRIKQRVLTALKPPIPGGLGLSGGFSSNGHATSNHHASNQSKGSKRDRPTTPQKGAGVPKGVSFVQANGSHESMLDAKLLTDDVLFDAFNRTGSAADSIEPATEHVPAEIDAADMAENGSVTLPLAERGDSNVVDAALLDSGSDTEEFTMTASRAASDLRGEFYSNTATYAHIWRTNWAISDEDGLGAVLAYRGLRVRVGMYSGVNSEADINFNSTMGRYHYTGTVRVIANAIASAGHGGQTIASNRVLQSALKGGADAGVTDVKELAGWLPSEAVWFNMGRHQLEGVDDEWIELVCVVPRSLVCRMAIAQHHTLRKTRCYVPGCMRAPIPGQVYLVGVQIHGLATLFSWNEPETKAGLMTALVCAMEAAAQWGAVISESGWAVSYATGRVTPLVGASSSGLPGCLVAVFTSPRSAIGWALHVRNALILQDWSPAILSHSACEQVGEGLTPERLDQLHKPPVWHEMDQQPITALPEPSNHPLSGPFHTMSQSGFPTSGPLISTSGSVNPISGPLYPLSASLHARPSPLNVSSSLQPASGSLLPSPGISPGSRTPSQPLAPATSIRATEPGFPLAKEPQAFHTRGDRMESTNGIGRGRGDPFARLMGQNREGSTSAPGYRSSADRTPSAGVSVLPSPRGSGNLPSPHTIQQLAEQGFVVHSNDAAFTFPENGPASTTNVNSNLMAMYMKADAPYTQPPSSPKGTRGTPLPSPPRSQPRSEAGLSNSRQLFGSGAPSQLFGGKSKGSLASARAQENGHDADVNGRGVPRSKQAKKVLFNDAPVLRGMRACIAVVRGGRSTASLGILGRVLYNGACMKRMQRLLRMAKAGQVVTTADILMLSAREHTGIM